MEDLGTCIVYLIGISISILLLAVAFRIVKDE